MSLLTNSCKQGGSESALFLGVKFQDVANF